MFPLIALPKTQYAWLLTTKVVVIFLTNVYMIGPSKLLQLISLIKPSLLFSGAALLFFTLSGIPAGVFESIL